MENFKIISSSPFLASYVKHYWILETDYMTLRQECIIPTGCMQLIFNRGERMFSLSKNDLQPQSFISGQSASYSNLEIRGKVNIIAIVFQPYGAYAFLDIPPPEFYEQTISIRSLENNDLIELENKIMEASDCKNCINLIEIYLLKRFNNEKKHNYRRMYSAINQINHLNSIEISLLADKTNLSEKQFNRVFLEYVGINPKKFLRIVRFQRVLYTLQQSEKINFAEIALDCGFFDQSHMITDFKKFSGYTPGEFIDLFYPYSDYFYEY